VTAVAGPEPWVHGLDLAVEELIQEERLDEVVGVVAQRDLVAPELVGVLVERPAAEPRAQGAEGVPRLDLLLDRQVDAGAPHLVRVALPGQVLLDDVGPVAGEPLLHVEGHQLAAYRGLAPEEADEAEECPRTL